MATLHSSLNLTQHPGDAGQLGFRISELNFRCFVHASLFGGKLRPETSWFGWNAQPDHTGKYLIST
jgi:hypothetical protein